MEQSSTARIDIGRCATGAAITELRLSATHF